MQFVVVEIAWTPFFKQVILLYINTDELALFRRERIVKLKWPLAVAHIMANVTMSTRTHLSHK